MKKDLPDPFKLRATADLVSDAQSADEEARKAQEAADQKHFTASHKRAAASAAWQMTQEGTPDPVLEPSSAATVPAASLQPGYVERPTFVSSEKKGVSAGMVLGIVGCALAALAILVAVLLHRNGAAAGEGSTQALVTATRAEVKADAAQRSADKADANAVAAMAKAQEAGAAAGAANAKADANAKSGCCGTCNACCQQSPCSQPPAVKAKPHVPHKAKPHKPAKPAVQPPKSGCETCIPTPKAEVHKTVPSEQCAINIQESAASEKLIGKMILGEDRHNPGKIGINFYSAIPGVDSRSSSTPYPLGPNDQSGKFDCNIAKKTVEANWPTVTAWFKVPTNCVPVKL